jgi:nucleotide-binding universal stress UspA family protein
VPGKIVIGFDGSDSGEDALALGMRLARATRAVPVVCVVHPQEYPIGVGRVDAEWVAYMHERATELLGRARRLLGEDAVADYRELSAPSESRGLHDLAEQEHAEIVVVGSSVGCASSRRAGWARSPSPSSTPPRPTWRWTPRPTWPSAPGPGSAC